MARYQVEVTVGEWLSGLVEVEADTDADAYAEAEEKVKNAAIEATAAWRIVDPKPERLPRSAFGTDPATGEHTSWPGQR